MPWVLVAVQGIDLTPIIVAVIGTASVLGGGGVFVVRSTNRKIEMQGAKQRADALKLYEETLASAQERYGRLETHLDDLRARLEARLTRAETELAKAIAERDAAVARSTREREALQHRIDVLQAQVEDLRRQLPGRRHRDPPRQSNP